MKREKLQFKSGVSDFSVAVKNSISEIKELSAKNDFSVLNFTFFINSLGDNFYKSRKVILNEIKNTFNETPALSVIGQPPADGSPVLIEVEVIYDKPDNLYINYLKIKEDIFCTKIETPDYIEYHLFGMTCADKKCCFDEKVSYPFEIMDQTLKSFEIDFNNIVRQWNYTENIVGFSSVEEGEIQKYQILNNVRQQYYTKYQFVHGYPAATGIGMSAGGFVLDCIAIKEKSDIKITPVKNPVQVSAYDYSERVLIGSKEETKIVNKAKPKFERAKLYKRDNKTYSVLISGTAAIHDETSISLGNASKQTKITLDNIKKLIEVSENEVKNHGFKIKNIDYSYLRVYIKNTEDYKEVKSICDSFSSYKPVYLISDICRKELLVEIEGVANICL